MKGKRASFDYRNDLTGYIARLKLRKFSVLRKKGGYDETLADECFVAPSGALILRTEGHLVIAYAPEAWVTVEEAEVE